MHTGRHKAYRQAGIQSHWHTGSNTESHRDIYGHTYSQQTGTYKHIHTYTHTSILLYMHAGIHTHTYIHTYTHMMNIYIYACHTIPYHTIPY